MQNHFQSRRNIGSHDKAPCPAPLSEEARTRRHAHRVEARPDRKSTRLNSSPSRRSSDLCKTIFKADGISGATTKRPALLRCLKKLEHGDTLTVWKLDRLGRSLRDLITMPDDLKKRGVKFRPCISAREI